jgi:putative flippase GtrA
VNNLVITLIPAFEPDEKLIVLLEELGAKTKNSLIVVDDGSSGSAAGVFKEAERFATVLRHDENKGKGRAIRTGLEYIQKHFDSDSIVITMDADGQHTVDDAIRVCEAVDNAPQLVIGSRAFAGKVPMRSKFGNVFTRGVYSLVTGKSLHDTQTGLRAFSASMIPFLMDIDGDRYEYEMNVLLECSRQDIPIKEVPIKTVYVKNNASSHFDTVKDSLRIYKDIIKFSLSSFAGFVIDFCIYSLMIWLTKDMLTSTSLLLSNVTARAVSSSANFYINKRFVFKNRDSVIKTALKYFALVIGILIVNTLLLTVLVEYLVANKVLSKLIVEIVLFFVSWLVQRFFIFKKGNEKEPQKC